MAVYRVGVTFDNEQIKRFRALAEFDRKKPATLASEILQAYMHNRAGDIDLILQTRAEYDKNLEALRNRKSASSDEVPAKKESE